MTIAAALALVALDFFLLTVMFLHRPAGAGILTGVMLAGVMLAGVMLTGALAAVLLRWRWLLLAFQNVVTAVTLLRLLHWEGPGEARDRIGPVLFVLLLVRGNLVVWRPARAIPPARPG